MAAHSTPASASKREAPPAVTRPLPRHCEERQATWQSVDRASPPSQLLHEKGASGGNLSHEGAKARRGFGSGVGRTDDGWPMLSRLTHPSSMRRAIGDVAIQGQPSPPPQPMHWVQPLRHGLLHCVRNDERRDEYSVERRVVRPDTPSSRHCEEPQATWQSMARPRLRHNRRIGRNRRAIRDDEGAGGQKYRLASRSLAEPALCPYLTGHACIASP